MTIEEAARILDPETSRAALAVYAYDHEKRLAVCNEACRLAAKILRKDEPPNHLTLDELREMVGEPVYLPEAHIWALVGRNPFELLLTFPQGEQCAAEAWYKEVGPAYRRKPEVP